MSEVRCGLKEADEIFEADPFGLFNTLRSLCASSSCGDVQIRIKE
jgi:hypothetical protein